MASLASTAFRFGNLPMSSSESPPSAAAPRKKYVRAVGPRLRKLLYLIFVLFALLFANSGYLATFTFLEWFRSETYQDYFYQYMFLAHLVMGLLLIVPVVVFGFIHMWNTKDRRNRRAVRIGYVLFVAAIAILVSGLLLVRIGGFDLRQPLARNIVYWMHVICPLVVVWLYWLHRLAGPRIKWRIGGSFAVFAGVAVASMVIFQMQDPRQWNAVGPDSGTQYFQPSLARTVSGNFIPGDA